MKKMKVYLAGPEVFDTKAKKIGKVLVKACKKKGLRGLYPLDNKITGCTSKAELSRAIYLANKKMIDDADYVIANINQWRGQEPDSGTVWEIGYAVALGKPVYAYIDDPKKSYLDRMDSNDVFYSDHRNPDEYLDSNDKIIEHFDNPVNLMIFESITILGSFEACLHEIAKRAKNPRKELLKHILENEKNFSIMKRNSHNV